MAGNVVEKPVEETLLVIVSACVYGDPVALASVPTILIEYELGHPAVNEPTVKLLGTVVLLRENCEAAGPLNDSVMPPMFPDPWTAIAPTVPAMPQVNVFPHKEIPVIDGV